MHPFTNSTNIIKFLSFVNIIKHAIITIYTGGHDDNFMIRWLIPTNIYFFNHQHDTIIIMPHIGETNQYIYSMNPMGVSF